MSLETQVRDRPTEPLTEPLSEAMELFARQVLPEAEAPRSQAKVIGKHHRNRLKFALNDV